MGRKGRKYGFETNKSYPAVVIKIKNDRIFFELTNMYDEKFTAAYFINGGNINPHQIFRVGQQTTVTMISLCDPTKNNCGITMLVVPDVLPSDVFLHKNPLGSMVEGIIEKITGETMIVMLDKNVYAVTKRCKHAKSGLSIQAKIDKYRNKRISLRTFAENLWSK